MTFDRTIEITGLDHREVTDFECQWIAKTLANRMRNPSNGTHTKASGNLLRIVQAAGHDLQQGKTNFRPKVDWEAGTIDAACVAIMHKVTFTKIA